MARVYHSLVTLLMLQAIACGSETVVGGDETETSSEETSSEECPELVWNEDDVLSITTLEDAETLPLYTHIEGSLRVTGVAGLVDLGFLRCLTDADSVIIIDNPDLESLEGLERLVSITPSSEDTGTMGVSRNARLRTLEGLSGLVSTPRFTVHDNPLLESLEGASALREVSNWLSIVGNDSLQTIGLRALEVADEIQIGYAECIDAGLPVVPRGNAGLVELDAFDSLVQSGRIRIGGNPNLASLEPLRTALVDSNGLWLQIEANPSLTLAHIQDVVAGLDANLHTCENLDDPAPCICVAPEP